MTKPKLTAWCDRRLITCSHYYALCLTPKAFKRELKHLGLKRSNWPTFQGDAGSHATTHFFESRGKHCAIVCLSPTAKRHPIEVAGLLVHEAVHIWQAAARSIGEHLPSDEFEAYSVQTISQELMSKFSELGGTFDTSRP